MAAKTYDSHNRSILRRARAGDLLEFNRGWYSHWGVYIGNEQVVHLGGVDNDGLNGTIKSNHVFTISGKTFNKAVVRKDNFWKVVLDSKVDINNGKDKKCRPRAAHEVVKEALSKLGEIGYNVLWKNCEHFAAFCRYGVNWSEQADKALMGMAVAGATVVVGGILREVFKGKKEKNKTY
ncbi:phospholipase A and acyltransferase 2-like [Ostrea edulis]|uniref:phospholipase A and acyltransferase 2-like n=1 Tax=Ostrea edulis TaxID=37623 RepID=UPI0024AF2119|nr:phospholipase A and acyltransferase 2-like [Ostrea edulis]